METQAVVLPVGQEHPVCDPHFVIDQDSHFEFQERAAVLAVVKAMVTDDCFLDIERAMADSYNRNFKIVDQPIGEGEDQGHCFGDIFVHQTTNGGISGDDYAGTISIPLPNGKFLQFDYWM